jgi:uncharacterized membrane protein
VSTTEAPPTTEPLVPSPAVLEEKAELDGAVDALRDAADQLIPAGPARDALQGDWLGHPVHPLMTDLVIGFWTSAFVLDLFPVKRLRAAADTFVALGLVSAAPTVVTGLADWTGLSRRKQRVGVVHAGANAVAAGLYALSLANRVRGRRGRGITFAMAGAGVMSVGGFLGGHLAFGELQTEGAEPNVPTPS